MAFFGPLTLTGDRQYILIGSPIVNSLEWYIFTAGLKPDFRTATQPRRVMHAGWLALLTFNEQFTTYDAVFWHKYIEFEHEIIDLGKPIFEAAALLMSIPPGTTIKLWWEANRP